MKFCKIMTSLLAASATLAACSDEMDYKEVDTSVTMDYIKEKWDKVAGLLSPIYYQLDYDFGNYSGAMLASATDEAVYSHAGNSIEGFYNGAWSPTNSLSTIWSSSWSGISQCNHYLDNFLGLTFDDYILDEHYAQEVFRYQNFEYEVRALRAYFYFTLVRSYGGVPLKTADLDADAANALPRASADEIFNFIDSECAAIADSIIKDYGDLGNLALAEIESGRVNDIFVLALRARAALYHASPLFNTSNDKSLWEKAALANKAVIDSCLSRGMTLLPMSSSMSDVINTLFGTDENYVNCQPGGEIIFSRRTTVTNAFEKYNFPIGMANANGGNCPTQNLVDAFEMRNGKAIDDAESGYDPANPYADRDLRLAATVAVNGDEWPTSDNKLQTYYGGANALPITYATPTGYYLKKLVNKDQVITTTGATTKKHNWITFRLAEFYLNYAEAMLNLTGDGYQTATVDGVNLDMTAAQAINAIRARAGQPDIAEGLSADDFKQRYENERYVELAFEGHRFFDVRRWKEAPKYFTTIKTMDITMNADSTFNYTPKVDNTTRATWNDKMYLFPIPQSDLLKSAGGWSQNPGW